jgi:hypothetical protein
MRAPTRAALAAVAIVFVALTSLAVPVAAGAAAGHEVPFKGSLQGVDALNFTVPCGPLAPFLLTGTGNATHLGRFTVDFPHCVNFDNGFGSGTFVLTAANGDTVTGTVIGQAVLPPANGVLSINETWAITGGTGRFGGATGIFTMARLNTGPDATTGSFEGTISSPGASKH